MTGSKTYIDSNFNTRAPTL